ncbi:tyrosine-type recombinase/integrase [Vagococcus fluvialis]|uniref:tyrosine-type recombinase/integrase n=1 Tax=Vagococcus fluvialis TaxID=2738 RepID=UPI002B2B0D63|nr:tyrosine-type recombinase/integrase [Vagococcus fluvialis]
MTKIEKYKKKNGQVAYKFRIYIGLDSSGKQKYIRRSGFNTKKDALIELTKIEQNKELSTNRLKFLDVYKEWVSEYEHTVRTVTYNRTIDLFRIHILPVLGSEYLDTLSLKSCQQILNKWANQYVNFKILKSYSQRVLDYAVKQNIIAKNYMKEAVLPRKKESIQLLGSSSDRNVKKFYTKTELIHFLSIVEEHYDYMLFTAFRLLAFTGLRKSELHALKWSDIIDNQSIRINKSLTTIRRVQYIADTKSNASNRIIDLDQKTIDILSQWRVMQQARYARVTDNHLIFTRDIPLKRMKDIAFDADYLNRALHRITTDYQIEKITIHGFRHTHASLLFESGATIKEVQDRLGHANSEITLEIYTHVSTDLKRKTALRLSEYIDSE